MPKKKKSQSQPPAHKEWKSWKQLLVKGKFYNRIKFEDSELQQCECCGVTKGSLHTIGCVLECCGHCKKYVDECGEEGYSCKCEMTDDKCSCFE